MPPDTSAHSIVPTISTGPVAWGYKGHVGMPPMSLPSDVLGAQGCQGTHGMLFRPPHLQQHRCHPHILGASGGAWEHTEAPWGHLGDTGTGKDPPASMCTAIPRVISWMDMGQ